jgi:hypothetical protein
LVSVDMDRKCSSAPSVMLVPSRNRPVIFVIRANSGHARIGNPSVAQLLPIVSRGSIVGWHSHRHTSAPGGGRNSWWRVTPQSC